MIDESARHQDVGPRKLTSNGVQINFDDWTFAPQQEVREWRAHRQALRRQFHEDGYVLLRGALDPQVVLRLRADYFNRFEAGMFAEGTSPALGIFSGIVPAELPEYGTAGHPAYDFVRTAQFDAFTRNAVLTDIAETLLGGPVELVPRRIVRHFHRGVERASAAHVDFDYMDRGSQKIVTAWIPLGDCPIESGGLVYLERSHTVPKPELDQLRSSEKEDQRPITEDLGRTAKVLGRRWLWTDYRAGDVVLHSPHIVHASLDNSADLMRLSTDLRFRLRDTAADERWNNDWSADDGY